MRIDRRTMLVGLGASGAALAGAPIAAGAGGYAEDVAVLRQAYGALHPGLYRYSTPAQMADRFDRLAVFAATGPSLGDFYLALGRLTASVRCGHSFPNPFNQKKATRAALFGARDRVPFRFRWLDGRMVVTRGLGSGALSAGTEILSLDGVAAPALLAALMPYARADGGNDAKRRANLQVTGERWEAFDIYRTLMRHGAAGEPIVLTARHPDGDRATLEVAGMTEDERVGPERPHEGGNADPWTLAIRPDGVALLTMGSWALYDSKWDWRGFLDRSFAAIGDARGLVVDLRGNEGGEDCGNDIVARLIDRPVLYSDHIRRTRYRRTPAALDPYLDTWDPSFKDWGDFAVGPDANGFYRFTKYDDGPDGSLIQPKGPRFTRPVAVLVGADNSSATFQFASVIQRERLGRLVGGPTGGNRRGINGSAFFFLRLPASGLEVDLPLVGTFPRTPQPDAGLLPDLAVMPTAADITAGRDVELAAAVRTVLG